MQDIGRVIFWNFFLLIVVLLIVEAIFGGWFRGGALGSLHLPRDVFIRHEVGSSGRGSRTVTYRRDKWGLRGAPADPVDIDVLTVGGSTTNQYYHDETETWTAALQRRFEEDGHRIVFANAGIDGHSTVGHINSLELWFPRVPGLRPKFMLYLIGANDVAVDRHERFDSIVDDSGWERFRRHLSNNSAIVRLLRIVRGMIRARRANLVYANEPPRLVPVTEKITVDRKGFAGKLGAYAERVRTIARKTREMGAQPIFASQRRGDAIMVNGRMMATGPRAVEAYRILAMFNRTMLKACHAVHAICIDLAGEIDLGPKDFADYVHTNPQGSRKIAELLYRKLKPILLGPRLR